MSDAIGHNLGLSPLRCAMEWPLVLRTGFGNVHALGRWDHAGTVLIADAVNSGVWDLVAEFAEEIDWEEASAN